MSFWTNLLTDRSQWLYQASPTLQLSTTMSKSMPEKSLVWAYYILMEFADSIQEGDGLRIIRCWRMFLPILRQQLDELFHRGVHPACSTWFCFYAEDEATIDVAKNIPCDLSMEHLSCECVFINNNNIVTDKFCNIQHNCMIGYKVTTLALLTGGCSSASKSCNRNLFYNCPSGCNNHASVVWH